MKKSLLCAALLLTLTACSEPFIVFSGGELSGEEAPPPADWSSLESVETVQIETRPEDPYSVNIWAAGLGKDLYIGTGPDGTRWSRHLQENPRVRLRVDHTIYALLAHPVTDAEERRRVARAYVDKYELDADENWVMDAIIFRLDRR